MIDTKKVLKVGEFARILQMQLRQEFSNIRLEGEIASFTRAASGHWYFTLKDDTAQLKAVMFRPRNVLAGFLPSQGDKVEVLAQLALYEPRGELQLVVDVLKKAGQGSLFEQYMQLKKRLADEGLFSLERKRPLPNVAFTVGVVTSLQAAALADVRRALARRSPHVRYTVYHTPVQGEAATAQIVAALAKADAAGHDALLLCRGGGSLEDLWCFNEEAVVRAVAACNTPTIVGVGHESDITLAELAADVRAATPTAAAELVSRPTADLLALVQQSQARLSRAFSYRLGMMGQRLDHAESALVTPSAKVGQRLDRLDSLARSMAQPLKQRLQTGGQALKYVTSTALQKANQTQAAQHRRLGLASTSLAQQLQAGSLAQQASLERFAAWLDAASPQKTLDRGYAFLEDEQTGQLLSHAASAHAGQQVAATLADGKLLMTVQATVKK